MTRFKPWAKPLVLIVTTTLLLASGYTFYWILNTMARLGFEGAYGYGCFLWPLVLITTAPAYYFAVALEWRMAADIISEFNEEYWIEAMPFGVVFTLFGIGFWPFVFIIVAIYLLVKGWNSLFVEE